MSHVIQFAATMPEAKFRSTKRRSHQVGSIRASEQHHESRTIKLVSSCGNLQMSPAEAIAFVGREAEGKKVSARKDEQKASAAKSAFSLASLWPVAVGIFLAGFAPEWHAMAAQAGIWALRLTFPLTLLATHREIGIDAQMAAILPQIALYSQLPLDGLLTMLTLARGRSLKSAAVQLVFVHAICTLVLWLIATKAA